MLGAKSLSKESKNMPKKIYRQDSDSEISARGIAAGLTYKLLSGNCMSKYCSNVALDGDAFCEKCRKEIDEYESIYGRIFVAETDLGVFIK